MKNRSNGLDEVTSIGTYDPAAGKRAAALAGSSLFHGLNVSEVTQIAARGRIRRFSRGHLITQQHSLCAGLHLMISGTAKWTMPCPRGRSDLWLEVLRAGDWFGEAELFTAVAGSSTAVALSDCEVLILPSPDFQILVARSPELGQRLIEMICRKLQRVRQLAADAIFLDIGGRLYRRLLDICRVESGEIAPGIALHHGLSQRELASSVGASRESLNKLLASWQRDGMITVGRGHLVVHKPLALAKAAACAESYTAASLGAPHVPPERNRSAAMVERAAACS